MEGCRGKVISDMSMSVDGFITGPNDDINRPLGEGGERLHEWLYGLTSWRKLHDLPGGIVNRDAEVLNESFENAGAVLMGKRMFDVGVESWGENPPFHNPVFVVTHKEKDKLITAGGTTYTFVTDGLESAVNQARAASGEKDVMVAGGANIVQQLVTSQLLDELRIHLLPLLLGEGRRLFDQLGSEHIELEILRVIQSPEVTHLRFRIMK